MSMYYLGFDCGSVGLKAALLDENENLVDGYYQRTAGEPVKKMKSILSEIKSKYGMIDICRVGVTGSGRKIAGMILGTEAIKNEIICHAIAAIKAYPDVGTIIDIGGQDSKWIAICDGIVSDFVMNTLCAAGTGSFLEQQCHRLQIPIEEFGDYAVRADKELNISGRCTVFAESDMISLQQVGESKENIIYGLCLALARNFIANIAKGKEFNGVILFQGGVAANKGIVRAFEQIIEKKIIVPEHFRFSGAIGAALIAKQHYDSHQFRGFEVITNEYSFTSEYCQDCENRCHVIGIKEDSRILGYMGDRCEKWH